MIDGKEYVVSYWCHELKHPAVEREALSVVWVAKEFYIHIFMEGSLHCTLTTTPPATFLHRLLATGGQLT